MLLFLHLELEAGARARTLARQQPGSLFVQAADTALPRFERAFDCLVISLPRVSLQRLTQQLGLPTIDRFKCTSEAPAVDPVVLALGESLLQSLGNHVQGRSAFVDHVLNAIAVHLLESYGQAAESNIKGGLEASDLTRAKSLLGDVSRRVPIEEVAGACGLSASHFSRAFQRSTGFSPHRWQMNARVDLAKHLLRDSELRLADVAARCGFADQSHFSRVFRAIAGASPHTFRRASRMGDERD